MFPGKSLVKKCLAKCLDCLQHRDPSGSLKQSYLPGTEVNHDQEGGSSRVRLDHCTSVGLTSTITPNVGNSSA